MHTVGRKQVDNKITSKIQIGGGRGFHVEEEGTPTGGKNHVDNQKNRKNPHIGGCEVHAEEEVMQTLRRMQVDNKVTSETQLAGDAGLT